MFNFYNMKLLSIASLSLALTFSLPSMSQDGTKADKKLIKKLQAEAYGHYDIDEFHEALPLLLKLDSLQPNNAQTLYKIGVSYYNSHDQHESFKYLDRVRAMDFHKDHHMLDYYLGRSLHLHEKFDEAIVAYEKFKSEFLLDKDYKAQVTIEELDRLIENCKNGKALVKNPLKVKITNLGPSINTEYSEYAPVISADETELIFTARRPTTTGGGTDATDFRPYEDLYITTKSNDEWTKVENMGPAVNTIDHDASVGLSPDGQELFIYRSDPKNPDSGDLLISILEGKKWSVAAHLPTTINSQYHETHASITSDETVLYFTSDKPGGIGGRDIYMVKKLYNGEWATPRNLGDKINTIYDEDGPFINPDGKTLYFSSKGHNSIGGYDIFKSIYDEKSDSWSAPENVGYPINTAADDVFFSWTPDGKKAYFASFRDGGYGREDIYLLEKEVVEDKKSLVVLTGNVISKKDQQPIGAQISVVDNGSGKTVATYRANSATGHYVVVLPAGKDYGVTVNAKDHLFYSENINFPVNTYNEVKKNFVVEPFQSGSTINLRNVFFETNSADLKNTSFPELDKVNKFLKENPTIYIKIEGHTDSVGREIDNYILSKLRTESIQSYLVSNGIDASRLLTIGYGEISPEVSNATEEGRAQNRRVIVTLIDKAKDAAMYDQVAVKVKEMEAKYKGTVGKSNKMDKVNPKSSSVKSPVLKLFNDTCVYFFVNDFKINAESKRVLDQVSALLTANPKLKIEINGFYSLKDGEKSRGQYGLKRSILVQNYLLTKKIDKARIVNLDLNGVENDSEEIPKDRIHNRRVELKILGR